MLLSQGARSLSTNVGRQLLNQKKQIIGNYKFVKRQSKILTVPNVLTMSRIAATPGIGYFIWNGMYTEALPLFAYAAATDMLDGWIARKFKAESEFGAILDPVADKFLMTTCFVAMYHVELMPLWLVKGFILRDLLLFFGGGVIRYYGLGPEPTMKKLFDFKNHPTIGFGVTMTSKCNTALQVALITIHLSCTGYVGIPTFDWSLFGLQCLTAFTTCYSFAQYTSAAFLGK